FNLAVYSVVLPNYVNKFEPKLEQKSENKSEHKSEELELEKRNPMGNIHNWFKDFCFA
ncbi:19610_t:CDS:1, partial [Gigaspora margarita]